MSKYCTKCHTPLSEDSLVCPNCGMKQSQEQSVAQKVVSTAAEFAEKKFRNRSS